MGFWSGVITTTLVIGFFICASKNNREYEIYEEGFLAGKESEKNDRKN